MQPSVQQIIQWPPYATRFTTEQSVDPCGPLDLSILLQDLPEQSTHRQRTQNIEDTILSIS